MTIKRLEVAITAVHHGNYVVDTDDGLLIDKSVKFKVAFSLGSLEAGKTFKLRYLVERWTWFNDHCFGGQMKVPDFEITKNFKDIKLFGSWAPFLRVISMHPKLWSLKSESQLLGTLLHEMCHQYVGEVMDPYPKETAHGPIWQGTMRAVGMSPSAKSMVRHEDLRSLKEDKVVEKFETVRRRATFESFPASQLLTPAVLVNKARGRETQVMIIGGHSRTRVDHYSADMVPGFKEKDVPSATFNWFKVEDLYLPSDAVFQDDFPAAFKTPRAKQKATTIVAHLQANKPKTE